MDHDNKIKMEKAEVKLFLPEHLYPISKTSPQIYDLEDEYAKTKKNKSPFIFFLMVGLFLFVGLLTFGVTKYIDYKNKQIDVGIDVFEDLNLMKLLDMVTRTEESLNTARVEKSRLEILRDSSIAELETSRDAELYALEAKPIRKSDKLAREKLILSDFDENTNTVLSEFNIQIAAVDQRITDITQQLEGLDSTRIQQAQEQQVAMDSQKHFFEIEKQQIVERYESTIEDLQQKISDQQKAVLISQKNNLDDLSGDYEKFFELLDPVIEDERADAILEEVADYETNEIYSASTYQKDVNDDSYTQLLIQAQDAYEGLDYLTGIVLTIPQENSIPVYVAAIRQIAYLIGQNLSSFTSSMLESFQKEIEEQRNSYETTIAEGKAYYEDIIYDGEKYIASLEATSEAQGRSIEAYENEKVALEKQILEIEAELIQKKEQLATLKEASLQIQTLQEENKASLKQVDEYKKELSVLYKAEKFFDELSSQNGDAGYVLNTDDPQKILVYISPLFQGTADSAQAFIFRKADELIGSVSLVEEHGYMYAVPDSAEIAKKIRANDRILLNLVSK